MNGHDIARNVKGFTTATNSQLSGHCLFDSRITILAPSFYNWPGKFSAQPSGPAFFVTGILMANYPDTNKVISFWKIFHLAAL